MQGNRRNSNDDSLGCLVYVFVGIFLMPIVGLAFMCGKNPEKKPLGLVLLILGAIIWITIGVISAS